MNLYFFAPWIILAFMIAVVITTLMVVHFLLTLCFVDVDGDKLSSSTSKPHRNQPITRYRESFHHNPMGKSNPHQLPTIEPLRRKNQSKTGGNHLKLPLAPWIKWGRRSKSRSNGRSLSHDEMMRSYMRSSSFCDISVTPSSYQPYPSPWVISSPEMYQRSPYHHDEMDNNPNDEDNMINMSNGNKLRNQLHSSYDSLTTTATTDTEFYRDWNHSIEFSEFNDLYCNNNIDPKYKDTNQNVIYI